jgi:outer membrane protein assembly factor BamB
MERRLVLACVAFSFFLFPFSLSASDWAHWRGPTQTGVSPDKNLPDKVDGNVIWRAPFGCRSTPLVLKGRVYLINYDSKKVKAGGKEEDVAETIEERVMCLDANTGKPIWQYTFPVFHTDIVTSRLGWTNIAADPATGYIYAHGTQGLFLCLDGKDGKLVWSHSMGEEYGRVSGYGGRVTSPIVDEDFAILGMVNSSWGDQAKGANRYVAFDKRTGKVVWWSEPAGPKGTYYSAPVIATINGQRQLIAGAADGSVFGIQVHTGKPIWSYKPFSVSPINSTPVVEGNFVFIGHGEESPGTNVQGRVICLDASMIENGSPKLVWQVDGIHARYASPVLDNGRLYMPDDGGRLYCLDTKSGQEIWKFKYGRGETRGSPVLADGKIYVGEVSARFHILEPGAKKCKRLSEEFFPGAGGVDIELNGTPAVAEGKVFLSTTEEIICIGRKDGQSVNVAPAAAPAVTPGKIAQVLIVPAEVALHAGQSATFTARAFDADGNFLKEVKADWTLPAPVPPPGAKANPPALKGVVSADGKVTVDAKVPNQGGIVLGTVDGLSAKARVRVVADIPYANDFEKIPDGAVPGGWVNTAGKFVVKSVNGNKVLAKVNNKFSPLFSRGNAYITLPTAKDYTIQCDVQGTKVGDDLPEMGVGANRYTLMLAGKEENRLLRLLSWEALPRIDGWIAYPWKPGVWYTLKLTTDIHDGKGVIRGKVWPRDAKEPAAWTVEVTDSHPIAQGSATLYGYVTGNFNDKPGTEIYYDNLRITSNKAAPKVGGAQVNPMPETNVLVDHPQRGRRPLFPLLARLRNLR